MSSTSYTMTLASFASNLTPQAIPSSFKLSLPILVLDIVGVMLTGIVQPIYPASHKAFSIVHGDNSSQAIQAVDGSPFSFFGASYLNGIAAGAFQLEHVVLNAHPSSAVLPTLLTYASTRYTSGEEFLTALAVGYEVCSRIGLASTSAVEDERGFHNPAINGPLGTAAAVGNLLGWDSDTIASAMGIAASSSGGLLAFQTTDAMTKQLHPGHGGPLGLEAALLANAGVRGPQDVLENAKGFLHAFSPAPNATALTDQLGERWDSEGITAKLYPMHSRFQTIVSGIQRYKAQDSFNAESITNVTVNVGPRLLRAAHQIPHPDTLEAAQYSAPFCIAAAILLDLSNPFIFNETLVQNQAVQDLSGAIVFQQVYEDEDTEAGYVLIAMEGQTSVNITASDDSYPGRYAHPQFLEELDTKFENVVKYLGVEDNAQVLRDSVKSLWEADDVYAVYQELVAIGSKAANPPSV